MQQQQKILLYVVTLPKPSQILYENYKLQLQNLNGFWDPISRLQNCVDQAIL